MRDAVIVEAVAPEVTLTGEMPGATRAARLGPFHRVVPDGRPPGDALRLADRTGRDAPLAVSASKRIASDRQRAAAARVFDSEDAREGATAFNERRPPVRPGR